MKVHEIKRGQVWTTDFIAGFFLFLAVIFIMIKIFMSMDLTVQSSTYADAIHLSSSLLSEGYPSDWTNDTVMIPGIAKNNRVNETKLAEFREISYEDTLTLYQLSPDYIFFFNNGTTIFNFSQCVYGYNITTDSQCNPIMTSLNYSDLTKIDRIVVMNGTLMRMTIYVWQ